MHVFYFLTPQENFDLLRELCVGWRDQVGISFRRYTPSGFDPGYISCSWEDNLATEYMTGGFSEVYLTTNNTQPRHAQDWDFSERQLRHLLVLMGGRVCDDELEQSYLRVVAKQSKCVPLYKRLRRLLNASARRGLYAGNHHYKDNFYSVAAAGQRMVGKFGGYEYSPEPITG